MQVNKKSLKCKVLNRRFLAKRFSKDVSKDSRAGAEINKALLPSALRKTHINWQKDTTQTWLLNFKPWIS